MFPYYKALRNVIKTDNIFLYGLRYFDADKGGDLDVAEYAAFYERLFKY